MSRYTLWLLHMTSTGTSLFDCVSISVPLFVCKQSSVDFNQSSVDALEPLMYVPHGKRSMLVCRTYELAFGAALVSFSFVPTFRHFRVLNVIGLIGTTFTEWYAPLL